MKKNPHSQIYDDYLRDQFAPFVTQQLNTMWKPEHFDRIQHVLSSDNYYRQTEPETAASRPKSRSTRHILLWLNEQSKLKQATATRQPPSGPSSQFDTTNVAQFPQHEVPPTPMMQHPTKEPLPTHGKEIMGQVSNVIQDLSVHWRLKHVISRRFCRFLLKKKVLKPYVGQYQDGVEFDERQYYVWNYRNPVNRNPRQHLARSTTSVPNLDATVMSQMRTLIKSQRDMIDDLKLKMSRTALANSETMEATEEQSFQSTSHREEAGNKKRKLDPELNRAQVQLKKSKAMTERQTICPKRRHIASDPEIFYDADVSNSSHSIRCRQDLSSKSAPRCCIDSKDRKPSAVPRPSTVPHTPNIESSRHSSPSNPVRPNQSTSQAQTTDVSESGFLFHIKKNLSSFGQQTLVSMGLKSYLFKGATAGNVETDTTVKSASDGEDKVRGYYRTVKRTYGMMEHIVNRQTGGTCAEVRNQGISPINEEETNKKLNDTSDQLLGNEEPTDKNLNEDITNRTDQTMNNEGKDKILNDTCDQVLGNEESTDENSSDTSDRVLSDEEPTDKSFNDVLSDRAINKSKERIKTVDKEVAAEVQENESDDYTTIANKDEFTIEEKK